MNYKQYTGRSIRQDFEEFHKKQPRVYEEFIKLALQAIRKEGKQKISAKLILNVIRWNVIIEATPQTLFDSAGEEIRFTLNDAFSAYYARLFAQDYPQHASKLEFRRLRNEDDQSTFPVTP